MSESTHIHTGFEWAIINNAGDIHRGPYNQEEDAREWIANAIAAGVSPKAFHVAKRPTGPWERR